jgi:EAL domain-containing protein (putative c-di-GMP-specific phosphodiesterase class I)
MDGKDPDSLMKCSDAAMHHAKEEGKNNYQFYTETMNKVAYERLVLESELRRALERDEFLMYFQPKVNPENRKVVSMEALVRWQHPDRGFVSPEKFITLAEETGLIIPLGEWILRQCCKQNKAWQLEGFSPVRVAVNLSNRQFEQKNLLKTISDILQETQLAPEHLELEITESSIMKDPDSSVTLLQELKKTGISIAIDDFGTGHSSLHCLKQLPLDTLKVDRSFVMNIIKNENDTAIAKAIIAMAKNLNLKVVAEGVEDEEQFALLRALGCDEIQGYLFSPPLPAHEFRKFLEKK